MSTHDPNPPSPDAARQQLAGMMRFTPYAHAIGLRLERMEQARVWGRVASRDDLIGDPTTGVIAGGVITAMLDHLSGASVIAALQAPQPIATLDLRIDYMRPAAPGRDVLAMAHCYKLTRSVAFTRAIAYQDDPDDPIANAVGAFMLASDGGRGAGANLPPRGDAS